MVHTLDYNLFNTLIFSGIIFGFTFCINAVSNNQYASKARLYLMLTVLAMTISNFQWWLIDIGFREKYNIPEIYYVRCDLLILPFFYLFVRYYLGKVITKREIYLLLIPFLIGTICHFGIHISNFQSYILTYCRISLEVFTILYTIIISLLIFKEIKIYEQLAPRFKGNIKSPVSWIKNTMYIAIFIYLVWAISTHLYFVGGQSSWRIFYPLWISISTITYWVGFKGTIELKIIRQRELIRNSRAYNNVQDHTYGKKNNNKGKILHDKIVQQVKNDGLFLNQNLSLDSLSEMFSISPGYLSQLVNRYSNKSFSDLVNDWRIDEVKKMLLNEEFSNYTIEAIGLEAGFNTKSNFYTVFKKATGTTPNRYKRVQNL